MPVYNHHSRDDPTSACPAPLRSTPGIGKQPPFQCVPPRSFGSAEARNALEMKKISTSSVTHVLITAASNHSAEVSYAQLPPENDEVTSALVAVVKKKHHDAMPASDDICLPCFSQAIFKLTSESEEQSPNSPLRFESNFRGSALMLGGLVLTDASLHSSKKFPELNQTSLKNLLKSIFVGSTLYNNVLAKASYDAIPPVGIGAMLPAFDLSVYADSKVFAVGSSESEPGGIHRPSDEETGLGSWLLATALCTLAAVYAMSAKLSAPPVSRLFANALSTLAAVFASDERSAPPPVAAPFWVGGAARAWRGKILSFSLLLVLASRVTATSAAYYAEETLGVKHGMQQQQPTMQQQAAQVPAEVYDSSNYVLRMIKHRFKMSEPETYESFLEILHLYADHPQGLA